MGDASTSIMNQRWKCLLLPHLSNWTGVFYIRCWSVFYCNLDTQIHISFIYIIGLPISFHRPSHEYILYSLSLEPLRIITTSALNKDLTAKLPVDKYCRTEAITVWYREQQLFIHALVGCSLIKYRTLGYSGLKITVNCKAQKLFKR